MFHHLNDRQSFYDVALSPGGLIEAGLRLRRGGNNIECVEFPEEVGIVEDDILAFQF